MRHSRRIHRQTATVMYNVAGTAAIGVSQHSRGASCALSVGKNVMSKYLIGLGKLANNG
jgi:hypothetical protein